MTNIKRKIFVFGFSLILASSSSFSQNTFDLTELESGQLLLNLGVTERISAVSYTHLTLPTTPNL